MWQYFKKIYQIHVSVPSRFPYPFIPCTIQFRSLLSKNIYVAVGFVRSQWTKIKCHKIFGFQYMFIIVYINHWLWEHQRKCQYDPPLKPSGFDAIVLMWLTVKWLVSYTFPLYYSVRLCHIWCCKKQTNRWL